MPWILSLYLLEGLFFAFVTNVSLVLFKNLNFDNAKIALYTSLLTIPWFLKPLLSPLLEHAASRRTFIITTSFLISALSIVIASVFYFKPFFYISCFLFFVIACFASIYDTNTDGFYITYLDRKMQARYIGIRTISYHIGRLIAQGAAIYLASLLLLRMQTQIAWQLTLLSLAGFIFLIAVYHCFTLPTTNGLTKNKNNWHLKNYKSVYTELLSLPKLRFAIIFVLIYNFSEAQLIKIVPLFLMDSKNQGGLNLAVTDISILIGGIGIIAMLIGISLSSWLLEQCSLKRCLLPITLLTCFVNTGYLYLSYASPSFFVIAGMIAITQCAFGLSNGLYMMYLLDYFGKSSYAMSLYAIGTALMGFTTVAGGALSGYMQVALGYKGFFTWIIACSLFIVFYCFYLSKTNQIQS